MVSMHTAPDTQPGAADAGGMNVAILETARELAARGVEVDLLTRAAGKAGVRDIAPGVVLHSLAAGESGVGRGALATVTDDFGEAVARLSRDAGYDVIHAHSWLSGIATLPVALELGIAFVQSFHGVAAMRNAALAPGSEPEPDRRLWSERYLSTQAEAIIASSSAEAASLIDDVGAPAGRVWVIPPGVDSALFLDGRSSTSLSVHAFLGIDSDRHVIAVIGRLQALKDQELAIRALALVPMPRPLLAIVGEPALGEEDYAIRLHRLANQLGVTDDVRFFGALSPQHVSNLLAASSLVLIPSHADTYGLVALEAAASGIPVIAADAGGLADSVVDGSTGLLLRSRDPREWARAIERMLGDPALRARLGAAGRERAEGLSWAATATSVLGVYASLR
jgi:D-inositol-3-phosphate glycosyltransferase